MSIESITLVGSIGTCATGLLLFLSLLLVVRQNQALAKQNKTLEKSIRSSTYQSLQPNEAAYHALLVNHPEAEQIIYKEDYEEGKPSIANVKAYWAALLVLMFMENVCVQHEDFDLIPDRLWSTWEAYMRHDLQRYSFLQKAWDENKEMFAHIGNFITPLKST